MTAMRIFLKFPFPQVILLFIIFAGVLLNHTIDEGRVQRKRMFSNSVRGEFFRVLQLNENCVINFKNSCHEFKFDINGIIVMGLGDIIIYKNNDYKYEIYFIKKSNEWSCYTPPESYSVVTCGVLKLEP
jgi:hypothetical protein